MRFNKIRIPEDITENKGIHNLNLSRLGNVIAFVGKNGSGKTRILDILEKDLFEVAKMSWLKDGDMEVKDDKLFDEFIKMASHFWDVISIVEEEEEIRGREGIDDSNILNEQLKELHKKKIKINPSSFGHYGRLEHEFKKIKRGLERRYLRRIRYDEIRLIQEALDSNEKEPLSFEELVENVVGNTNYNEFFSIHKTSLQYLAKLPHELILDYMEAFGKKNVYEKKVSHLRYLSLKKLVRFFLKKELTWRKKSANSTITEKGVQTNYTAIWELDGREFTYTEFSDGERTLFTYALLFFLIEANPNLNIKNSIVLIDEPELHLHPDAEIDLINGIRNAIGKNGQLIFTTHSINILSHLNYDEIFMVKDGEISHPSRTTVGKTLSELMGLEERINKLSEFLSSIATWTFVNFMAECFLNPKVIKSSNSKDPQLVAFKKAVSDNLTKQHHMLLDFGAGKGRLFEQIKSDYGFMEKINYAALEPEEMHHAALKNLGAKEVYKSYLELPKNSFDFILLCNVLHEIPIDQWVSVLNKIINSLTKDGYLIIIEAKMLTKGEKIGEEGFILLSEDEIKILFNLKKKPLLIDVPEKGDMITCVVIEKKQLVDTTRDNLLSCLKALNNNTLEKLIDLRRTAGNEGLDVIGFGRKSAFLSQLYINSQIAQMKIEGVLSSN